MKKIGLIGGGIAAAFLPFLALAQQSTKLGDVLSTVSKLLNTVIPILITLAMIYFIWGVIQYVTAKDEEKQKEARSVMINGIIGLFAIVAIWGLVALISKTFGVDVGGGAPTYTLPVVQPF